MDPRSRFALALLVVTSLLVSSPARAYTYGPYGCNLRWDQCYGDGGPINKAFACNTNQGSQQLVASFVPAWDVPNVVGMEYVIHFAADATALPAWWQFKNLGTCRRNEIIVNATNGNPTGACPDWSTPQAGAGILTLDINMNSARLLVSDNGNGGTLVGRREYFGFHLVIPNVGTVGSPSCAGCATPVCFVFSAANIRTQPPANSRYLTGPANLVDSDHATWQGGGSPTVGTATGCPAATPIRRSTWGSVKSLYR